MHEKMSDVQQELNLLHFRSFLKMKNMEIFIQFPHYGTLLLHNLNSCCENYQRGETIQVRKLFVKI